MSQPQQQQDVSAPSSLAKLTNDPNTWKDASFLSVTQLTTDGMHLLFSVAQEMKSLVKTKGGDDRLQHKLLATVFYEASTRTSCSFQASMLRLGGKVIHVDGKGNSSANAKGESLQDTIRCLESYVDVTVLRHFEKGSVGSVITSCTKPVISAGDGVGEHPTQALLDVFTIMDELHLMKSASKTPLIVVMLGDLKHGRTVHSLAKLLAQTCENITLRYCSPTELQMPDKIQDYVSQFDHVQQEVYSNLQDAVKDANVLYVTRIQKERFESMEQYEQIKGSYVVDLDLLQSHCPKNMIVMHPLPRVDEISTNVDGDPRAAYFRQMENGMYVRMALLALIFGKAQV